MQHCVVHWFRLDLRLRDNSALSAAAQIAQDINGGLVPLFVHCPEEEAPWTPGEASNWWLHQSLASLTQQLQEAGSNLVLRDARSSSAVEQLLCVARETRARTITWQERHEPHLKQLDERIKTTLEAEGLEVLTFPGQLLFAPDEIRTGSNTPYRVFTPYWNRIAEAQAPSEPTGRVEPLKAPETWPSSSPLGELDLEPTIPWAGGLAKRHDPGELGALRTLERFLHSGLERYSSKRDFPALTLAEPQTSGVAADCPVSGLSPHLHFGELSPRQVWHHVGASASREAEAFQRQLVWREFSFQILVHHPNTPSEPLRPEFSRFPWQDDDEALERWQKGETGFPMVDAGMRELWGTGVMHNRVRMVVASFLVKHLLIPWQRGARWFWDTLVDADLANNTMGWQWTAGCGADAAPYFRVFNPITQGKRFDPSGDYIRRYVPELAGLSTKHLHEPWAAPPLTLAEAGVTLGKDYPHPIVAHAEGRARALEAYEIFKERQV